MARFSYLRVVSVSCAIVVLLHFIERALVSNSMVSYLTVVIESVMAIGIGYVTMRYARDVSILRCALVGATVGVAKFILVLPGYLLQWDSSDEYMLGIYGYMVFSAIAIGYYSILGAFGGKLRQIVGPKGAE